MARFVILRDQSGNWKRPKVPLLGPMAPCEPDQPSDPCIDIVEMNATELREYALDPSTQAVTTALPTRLISCEPMDNLRDQDACRGWGLDAINAPQSSFDGGGSRVAILDTGIDVSHPAFDHVSLKTADFVGTGVEDVHGHGTHLAGTILGRAQPHNDIGIATGMDQLWVGKAIPDTGVGQSDSFLLALLWALRQNVDVIGFAIRFDIEAQIRTLREQGYPETLAMSEALHAYRGNLRLLESIIAMQPKATRPLVLAAVGNDCRRTVSPDFQTGPSTPAAARGVFAVGAVCQDAGGLSLAPFANLGPSLVAPGCGIISAVPDNRYEVMNSSSAAMAHTVGAAALWAQKLRAEGKPVSAQTLAEALCDNATTDGLDTGLTFIERGAGLVQAP